MPEVDRAVKVLEDGRFFEITHRVPGTWLLQGFLSEESAAGGEDPLLAAAGDVPDGRDYVTDQQAAAVFDQWVPQFVEHWSEFCGRLGIPEGATRR